jgi:hypothetical protein
LKRREPLVRFLALFGLLLVCAFFENLGDAGGYLGKKWSHQLLLAVTSMGVYGAVTVIIARGGWSFTHAFPIWYIFAYKLMGWGFAAYIDGPRISKYDVAGGALILCGLGVSVFGSLRSPHP